MNIDLSTIALLLVISSVFQAIIVFFQSSVTKKYPGTITFGIGCSFFALGFLFIMLQNVIYLPLLTVVLGNSLLLLALIFQYLGFVGFLSLNKNKWLPQVLFATCLFLISYFVFVYNSIAVRIFVLYLSFGIISFLIAYTLRKNKITVLQPQTRFLFNLYLALCLFSVIRAFLALLSNPIGNVLSQALLQVFAFTTAFIVNFIISFTFILMINKRISAELQDAKDQFEQIFNLSPDASLITTLPDGKIISFNIGFLNFSGYTKEEVVNKRLAELDIYEHLADREKLLQAIIDNQFVEDFELNFRHKNKTIRICSVSAKIIPFENGPHILSIIRDITDRKKSEAEVLYLSYHDQLTGLYNRRFYEEELERLDAKRNLPIALVMADVNGLKLINDAYGHQRGDKILQTFAAILKAEFRSDEIVSRIGGDEFVVLLPKTDKADVERIVNRLNAALSNVKIDHSILSVSLGFSIKNDLSEEIGEIFKQAEDAMYRQKLSISPSVKKATIDLIVDSIYEKNHQEITHSKAVGDLCEAIAIELGFERDAVTQIKIAGLRHDIGEIAIDDEILKKTGKLNEAEWAEIKRHPEIGYHILRSVNELAEIGKYVLEHHERWDGQGYPKGLKGEEISLQGRIIAIADAYSAMTGERIFSRAATPEEAIKEIKKYAGTQFDPDIAKIFVENILKKTW